MGNKILIVEDEKAIRNIIKFNLVKEGFEVITAGDGVAGYESFEEEQPDLLMLDIMMPRMDGLTLCKKIRETSSVPIIMLTAKAEEVDKVLGLEFGADDYITKPFSMRELIARVKANFRRQKLDKPVEEKKVDQILEFGELKIDITRFEITKRENIIDLTVREFELLKYLAISAKNIFSREELLEKVWGYEYYGDVRTVDVTVRRLREKIEDTPGKPQYILTKRGIGYYFKG